MKSAISPRSLVLALIAITASFHNVADADQDPESRFLETYFKTNFKESGLRDFRFLELPKSAEAGVLDVYVSNAAMGTRSAWRTSPPGVSSTADYVFDHAMTSQDLLEVANKRQLEAHDLKKAMGGLIGLLQLDGQTDTSRGVTVTLDLVAHKRSLDWSVVFGDGDKTLNSSLYRVLDSKGMAVITSDIVADHMTFHLKVDSRRNLALKAQLSGKSGSSKTGDAVEIISSGPNHDNFDITILKPVVIAEKLENTVPAPYRKRLAQIVKSLG